MDKGLLIVLSGPSGVGKGTILRKVMASDPNLVLSVSATTRKKRNGEIDGVNYHFLELEQFKDLIEKNQLLEYAVVYDNYYGTMKDKTIEQLYSGNDVILEIDPQGAKNIKRMFNDAVTIFLHPPNAQTLRDRLKGRGTETEEVFNKRVAAATEELNTARNYDYQLLNDNADECARKVIEIIRKEKDNRRSGGIKC